MSHLHLPVPAVRLREAEVTESFSKAQPLEAAVFVGKEGSALSRRCAKQGHCPRPVCCHSPESCCMAGLERGNESRIPVYCSLLESVIFLWIRDSRSWKMLARNGPGLHIRYVVEEISPDKCR